MAEARREDEWNRTSNVLAMIYNTATYFKPRREPSSFNPFSDRFGQGPGIPIRADTIAELKIFLPGGQRGNEEGAD